MFSRPPGTPSGDQQLEAYHHRLRGILQLLENQGKSCCSVFADLKAIDALVDTLYQEYKTYTEATVLSPHLFEEKRRQHHVVSQKYANKRATLKDYVPPKYVEGVLKSEDWSSKWLAFFNTT